MKLLDRILSDDPLIRAMALQSVLSAFGEGAFLTGSAVYFTRIVGLSAAQVGLGLTIGIAAQFLASVPSGRLADRIGTRRAWIIGSVAEVALFAVWFLINGFVGYVAVTIAMEIATSFMRAGRNAYRLGVFPRAQRVRSNAYMRAARNVGYALGALAGGVALGFHSNRAVEAMPLFTAAVLVLNVLCILPLPARPAYDEAGEATAVDGDGERQRSALHNHGFLLVSICDGVLTTHQVLLNTVIPLWLVEETNAPRVLLAWLFGTACVLVVVLQVPMARGVDDVPSSLRAQRRAAACFVLSCGIILATDHTVQWLTIPLVWAAHITVTGAEMLNSAGEWGLQAELSDPRRRGEYQGVASLGTTIGVVWAPAVYTYLAMHWGAIGWAIIASIVVVAAIAIHPAARAAERFLAAQQPASVG